MQAQLCLRWIFCTVQVCWCEPTCHLTLLWTNGVDHWLQTHQVPSMHAFHGTLLFQAAGAPALFLHARQSQHVLAGCVLCAPAQVAAANAEQIARKKVLVEQEHAEEMRIADYIRQKDAREQVQCIKGQLWQPCQPE